MSNHIFIRIYRLVVGIIIAYAVITQLFTFKQTPGNFFSYFTVLSNLLVSFVFILPLFKSVKQERLDMLRGAATLYTLITALGFFVLLGGKNEEFLTWVNIVTHYVAPFVMLLDWTFTNSIKISFRKSLIWIWFLLFYLAYSLIRGIITSWYPYGFLNPEEMGYSGVFGYIFLLTIGSLVLSWCVAKLSGGKLFSKMPLGK